MVQTDPPPSPEQTPPDADDWNRWDARGATTAIDTKDGPSATSSSEPPSYDEDSLSTRNYERVLRQVVAAFDHYPPWESTALLDALWGAGIAAGPQGVSVQRLLALTDDAEEIERAAEARARQPGAGLEDLYDAMRTVRSRVRMYGKDGELYLSPPGDGDDGAGRQEQATFRWPWQQEEA